MRAKSTTNSDERAVAPRARRSPARLLPALAALLALSSPASARGLGGDDPTFTYPLRKRLERRRRRTRARWADVIAGVRDGTVAPPAPRDLKLLRTADGVAAFHVGRHGCLTPVGAVNATCAERGVAPPTGRGGGGTATAARRLRAEAAAPEFARVAVGDAEEGGSSGSGGSKVRVRDAPCLILTKIALKKERPKCQLVGVSAQCVIHKRMQQICMPNHARLE